MGSNPTRGNVPATVGVESLKLRGVTAFCQQISISGGPWFYPSASRIIPGPRGRIESMGSSWQRLSHGQEGLWFLWKLVPDACAFHNVLPLRIRGPLDVEALRRSIDLLSARHPSLRMEFQEENGRPVQRSRGAD